MAAAYMVGEWIENGFIATANYYRVLALIVGVLISLRYDDPNIWVSGGVRSDPDRGLGAVWFHFRASKDPIAVAAISED